MASPGLRAPSLHALLAGFFDYAGVFAPARLDLPAALANYRCYQSSPDAWALGRLVVPVDRLAELEGMLRDAAIPQSPASAQGLPLSAVLASADAIGAVEEFNLRFAEHGARVETVELKVASAAGVPAALAGIPMGWKRYLEIPLGEADEATIDAIAAGGAFAKLRTGGLTAEAFPSSGQLIAALQSMVVRRLPFKLTAGLHHPLRGSFRLTYEQDAPCGVMYGYFNLLMASAILWAGGDAMRAEAALLEEDPASLEFDAGSVRWRGKHLETMTLARMRSELLHGVGTCSFGEPMDELTGGGWR